MESLWSLVGIYTVVATWRSVWMLTDQLIQGDVHWNLISTLVSGWAISILCCSASIPNWGTSVDGEAPTESFSPLAFGISYVDAMTEVGSLQPTMI